MILDMTPCLLINRRLNQAIPVTKWLVEQNSHCWEGVRYVYNKTQDSAPSFEVFGETVEGAKTLCEIYYPEGVE